MNHPAYWYFERFRLLQGLSDEQKRQIEQQARMLQLKRGQPIFLPGDPSDSVYVVKTGAAKIVGRSPEGCEVILGLLTPGDLFGELALTGDDEPQEHRAEAMDDSLLCQIPRDLLTRMIHASPAFGLHVTKLIGFRLRTLRTRVEELLGKSAPARLAHTLLELGRHHGIRDNGGVLIPLRLSQGDCAIASVCSESNRDVGHEPFVSVILPVWRDEDALARALRSLQPTPDVEVTVACVLGEESRYAHLRRQYPDVYWTSAPRGRAAQMNAGAGVARGRWLLFLHADSQPPPRWLDVVREADRRGDVAGAFALRLDSADWRARLIEWGVRIRVAVAGLPYGDQGVFVRRTAFVALNGYRDLPLMEDIDFIRRVKATGRLLTSRVPVITSARRWERHGWMRRSGANMLLATRFAAGASPARLAQQYFNRKAGAVVMMARAPWIGGKTRLRAADEAQHSELRHALFLDTLDAAASVAHVEHIVACDPADECERMQAYVGPSIDVIAQRGDNLGLRLAHVFEDTFRLGTESVVVVGSDLPDLPSALVRQAVDALRTGGDRLVLGPASDGGYYLIGMNQPHPELFDRIDWSTECVLTQTVDAARARDLEVIFLAEWRDVDSRADVDRLIRNAPASAAPRTRAWGRHHAAADDK